MYQIVAAVVVVPNFLVADDPVIRIVDRDPDAFIKRIEHVVVLAFLSAFAVAVYKGIVDFHRLVRIVYPHLHREFDSAFFPIWEQQQAKRS